MTSPYLGCQLAQEYELKRVTFPVAVEDKLDGIRITFVDGQGYTRNGKTWDTVKPFAEVLLEATGPGVHVDCEMMARNWNETSKLLKRVKDVDHAAIRQHVTAWIFDLYTAKTIGKEIYLARRQALKMLAKRLQGVGTDYKFQVVNSDIAADEQVLKYALQAALKAGREGIMVKDLNGTYQCKRTTAWLKLKPFKDITLTIVGFEESRGKCGQCSTIEAMQRRYRMKMNAYTPAEDAKSRKMKLEDFKGTQFEKPRPNCRTCNGTGEVSKPGVLGAFLCRDEAENDVKVGGGFTDDNRIDFWKRRGELLGRKIDVKVQDEKQNDIVARFPVFQRFRDDLQPNTMPALRRQKRAARWKTQS